MKVRIRLFALFREVVGTESMEVELAQGATAGDAWRRLIQAHPALAVHSPAAAVNARLANLRSALAEGDELAFLPPVSGG